MFAISISFFVFLSFIFHKRKNARFITIYARENEEKTF